MVHTSLSLPLHTRDTPFNGHAECPLTQDWYTLWPPGKEQFGKHTPCSLDEIRVPQRLRGSMIFGARRVSTVEGVDTYRYLATARQREQNALPVEWQWLSSVIRAPRRCQHGSAALAVWCLTSPRALWPSLGSTQKFYRK